MAKRHIKNQQKLNCDISSISNESCKPLHLNCEIRHNLNAMICSIDLKYYEILQLFCCFVSVTFLSRITWSWINQSESQVLLKYTRESIIIIVVQTAQGRLDT